MTASSGRSTPDESAFFDVDSTFEYRATIAGAKQPVLIGPSSHWWVTRTPDGPGSLELVLQDGDRLLANAWGAGSVWMLNQVPHLLGASDVTVKDFVPPPQLRDRWLRKPFKLARTDRPWDGLVGAIFGQKVQTTKAGNSLRMLAKQFGVLAPGPRRSYILPSPERVSEMGYADFHTLGIERKRSETLLRVAKEFGRIRSSFAQGRETFERRLLSLPGIGPWTVGMTTAVVYGHSDAVPVGDFHIPNIVHWHLAGEPRGDDTSMLKLLEPYRGHRWRVIRLAKSAGPAPRYGPRLSLRHDGLTEGL